MTSEREQYLLDRCLRLELELAIERGMDIAPPLPQIERRSLYEIAPQVVRKLPLGIALIRRRKQRHATADDIAQMRHLKSSGMRPLAIGSQLGFSETTARTYTRDVLLEREVGQEK